MKISKALMVACLLVVSYQGTSVHAAERAPTSKWVVEFADADCLMTRGFGTDREPMILSFRKLPIQDGASVAIIWHANRRNSDVREIQVDVGGGLVGVEHGGRARPLAGGNLRRIDFQLNKDQLAALANSERIKIRVADELDEDLRLPSMAAVLKLGNQCAVKLGELWGFSAAEQARIAIPPNGNIAATIGNADYPSDAIRKLEDGQTQAYLTIDPTGQPIDCAVVKTSGSEALDTATCRYPMKRAHFTPAVDVDGNSVRSLIVYTMRWVVL